MELGRFPNEINIPKKYLGSTILSPCLLHDLAEIWEGTTVILKTTETGRVNGKI